MKHSRRNVAGILLGYCPPRYAKLSVCDVEYKQIGNGAYPAPMIWASYGNSIELEV